MDRGCFLTTRGCVLQVNGVETTTQFFSLTLALLLIVPGSQRDALCRQWNIEKSHPRGRAWAALYSTSSRRAWLEQTHWTQGIWSYHRPELGCMYFKLSCSISCNCFPNTPAHRALGTCQEHKIEACITIISNKHFLSNWAHEESSQ